MNKIFTKFKFFFALLFLISGSSIASVSESQIIDYVFKSTTQNFKQLNDEEKTNSINQIADQYKSNTLTSKQKLIVYAVLLADLGLNKPEADKFKAILLYEMEKFDKENPNTPIYFMSRELLSSFVNTLGDKIIYEKVGIVKDERDLQLESMGAYSIKKEISADKRFKAINEIYTDYTNNQINLEDYRIIANISFE
jgi:hypothetical protein